jgi:hypothetical protein
VRRAIAGRRNASDGGNFLDLAGAVLRRFSGFIPVMSPKIVLKNSLGQERATRRKCTRPVAPQGAADGPVGRDLHIELLGAANIIQEYRGAGCDAAHVDVWGQMRQGE